MDIFEIRELVKRYHSLEKDDFPLIELEKQTIIKKLNNAGNAYVITAKEFEFQLREMFTQAKRAAFACVNLSARIKDIQIENSDFIYYIKPVLQVKYKNETHRQTFPDYAFISKTEKDDRDFNSNDYPIHLLPILLKTDLKNGDLIHKVCFNIIETNLVKQINNNI